MYLDSGANNILPREGELGILVEGRTAKAFLGFEISDVRTCFGFEEFVVTYLQLNSSERTFYGFDFLHQKREFFGFASIGLLSFWNFLVSSL